MRLSFSPTDRLAFSVSRRDAENAPSRRVAAKHTHTKTRRGRRPAATKPDIFVPSCENPAASPHPFSASLLPLRLCAKTHSESIILCFTQRRREEDRRDAENAPSCRVAAKHTHTKTRRGQHPAATKPDIFVPSCENPAASPHPFSASLFPLRLCAKTHSESIILCFTQRRREEDRRDAEKAPSRRVAAKHAHTKKQRGQHPAATKPDIFVPSCENPAASPHRLPAIPAHLLPRALCAKPFFPNPKPKE
jgi:hypothetical protein